MYYRPTKGTPKVQEKFVTPIKAMIEENPSFGYRTVAHLLGMNKNTVQRVFQCMGWQVCNGLWAFARAFRRCPRGPWHPMSAGRLICAGFGPGAMAGPVWPW